MTKQVYISNDICLVYIEHGNMRTIKIFKDANMIDKIDKPGNYTEKDFDEFVKKTKEQLNK